MRKLVLAAVAAGILSIAAIAIAAAHDDHSSGQWPISCVDLNDIVEEHLGRTGNVGIYQRTFGEQAEAACRNDHRNDVRSVFAWAIGGAPAPPPQPTPAPASPLVPPPAPQGTFNGRSTLLGSPEEKQFVHLPGGSYVFSMQYNFESFYSARLIGLTNKTLFTSLAGGSGQVEKTIRIDEGIYLMQVSSLGSGDWTISWHKSAD